MPLTGITLQPEPKYLELLEPIFHDEAEYFEITPETLWRKDHKGEFVPNAYHEHFSKLIRQSGKPVVAHGVGLSLGSADPSDAERCRIHLQRIAETHREFDFAWYSDHYGVTNLAGLAITLPVAVPMTEAMANLIRMRLAQLQQIVPDVGFENSVLYFLLGDWLDEPAFFSKILQQPHSHLLLDLHNAYTMAVNLNADLDEYVERLDLSRVIEIHLSGGTPSDPAWLPSGKILRLDSHDAAIPEPVWELYERVVPRCTNLRGVTVERMEGTVEEDDVQVIRGELRRAKEVLRARA